MRERGGRERAAAEQALGDIDEPLGAEQHAVDVDAAAEEDRAERDARDK